MLEWPEFTVYEWLAFVAADVPSRPALVFEGETTAYSDLLAESRRLTRALGVGAGDAIAIWFRDHPVWVETHLAPRCSARAW